MRDRNLFALIGILLLICLSLGIVIAVDFFWVGNSESNIVVDTLVYNVPNTNLTCNNSILINGFYYCNIDDISNTTNNLE